ncbi:protein timeless isoform X1 [Lucilia cuprina]|uniref:protein timeless isoform X1 n=1 Tax=Lucilia cuprina TaxID=7375 RepID=UPI001F06E184|nr:protein timeless isoform X1 [Lucilia cuprina]
MDWLLATPQLHSAFSSLGSLEGDTYVVSANALATLEEINYKLSYEDQTLRTFRRAIGFGQNVRSDLIPLLENTKDEDILDSVIRILVNLTVPVECLFSVDVMYRTEVGRHTIFELNKLLHTSKEAFTDPKSTKSVVEYMKHILESDSKLTPKKCDQINNCLLLLRNILHIPESNATYLMPSTSHNQPGSTHPVSMQNTILWNLFIQSIDKLLLYLMTCPQRAFWGVTMVQLIALIYKDQHVSTLQKLLNLWFEASLSESSEDNESNTSPPKQGSCDSSPMLTSDPTSDSSDNGSTGSKNGNSEDRRQALREETEATLQEVSRKGQEYQDSMLRVPADKVDSSEGASDLGATDCEEGFTLKQNQQGNEVMETLEDEETAHTDETVSDAINNNFTTEIAKEITTNTNQKQQQQQEQPAEQDSNTSNLADAANFMPPPALPLKSSTSASKTRVIDTELMTATPKVCQKSPHSGHVKLTMGNCGPQKREYPSSQSELSDCGYGTQVENQESISTSSNDDDGPQGKPQHQKPPCSSKARNKHRIVLTAIDKKELRRKKLVKRSKSSLINMKGLVQHTPTDEDISNLLKEFTVDFLLKGYGYLVEELHSQLLTNLKIPIDTSHFFWLVTYFLKFAAQLELDMEHINTILTFDVISYLTYEGVMLCEQLELNSRQEGSDLKPYLRRMHLLVTAIREFLQAIETYKKVTHLSDEDRERLRLLQLQISSTEDLRNLFVLLLRRFNPSLHTKQYLQDLVVTNHILLLILDSVTKSNSNIHIKMIDHISQFATLEIMHYYGMLLDDFNNNGEFVNDCIFTMMHHIGGDLGQIGTLFQPVILKTYSRIWEADYELCDDWSDLIEYVIHKFMNTPQKSPLTLPSTSLTELTKEHNMETTVCTWTQEEMDTLYWYYVQSKKHNDIVGKIVQLFSNNGNKQKSRISIIQQLLQQDIITLVEYDDLMKFEDAEYQRTLLTTPTSGTTESGIDINETPAKGSKPSDDIQILRDLIIKEKKQQHIVWLQKLLLECCYIKMILKNNPLREDHQHLSFVMEPVAYHCILKNKSIPVVQWNNEQATTMLYQPFVLLLHKLGFQLPADAGSVFARIPDFWTPEMMFNLAKKLGPLEKLFIKFDIHQFDIVNDTEEQLSSRTHYDVATTARNSLSSMFSLEVDVNDSDELAPIPEVDDILEKTSQASEIFAMPNAKQCNSIIRYTPEPTAIPTIPNWLQLVMRSKCNSSNATTTTNAAAAAASLANLATNACNESDIWMSSGKTSTLPVNSDATTAATTATTTTSTKATCSNLVEPKVTTNTTPTLGTMAAVTSAILHPITAAATLLQCPSINQIIGLQHEMTSIEGVKLQTTKQKLTISASLNTLTTTALTVATKTITTTALTIPLTTTLLAPSITAATADIATAADAVVTPSSLVTIATMPTINNAATSETPSALAVSFKDYQQQQHQQQQLQQHHQQLYNNNIINQQSLQKLQLLQQQQEEQQQQQQATQITYINHSDDDDSAMKSLERNDSSASSGFYTRSGSGNLEQELCAMVASAYEQEIANSDSASVASDLTRMYVSDEEHEYRVAHYH